MASWSMSYGAYGTISVQKRMPYATASSFTLEFGKKKTKGRGSSSTGVHMRDRSKNRKPLQKGRNLSIEAIQMIQALKRAPKSTNDQQEVIKSKFTRLLKFDMMAILRELLRQDHSLLALMIFAEIQKEDWYKPRVSLYTEIIAALARNDLFDCLNNIFRELKSEKGRLEAKTEEFNVLLEALISHEMTGLAMDCFELMKYVGCEPDRSTFKLLVNHLESKGETGLLTSVRQEAHKCYGDSLTFLDEQEELAMS